MAFITGTSSWLSRQTHHSLSPPRRRQCPRRRPQAKLDPDDITDDFITSRTPASSDSNSSPAPVSTPQQPLSASAPPSITAPTIPGVRIPDESESSNTAFVDGQSQNEMAVLPNEEQKTEEPEACFGEIAWSPSLQEHREQREAGLILPVIEEGETEWTDAWALAVSAQKGYELRNQYSRVGILIAHNFTDFEPAKGCLETYKKATLEDISVTKAKMVYEATGLPAIAETHDLAIDAPESGSRINKTLQQGYFTRFVDEEADAMIDKVRPISDENRVTRFTSAVAYYDGEIEVVKQQIVNVAIVFSSKQYATIAISGALDELYKDLSRRFSLTLDDAEGSKKKKEDRENEARKGKVLVGATLLKERILRDGKMLGDSIIKVSSFVNHMVDTDLMEVCGEELAERLRRTMPNKVLTVESTGLIVGLPTARKLGIPLVFARKTRPITISDSYQTTYRSATKGTTSELIVSCEYLEPGDRVLIIDDFLAGGSTAEALFKLAKMAHAKVVGVGVLIEKMSDGGRAFLSGYDVPVESLAKVLPGSEKGRIKIVEEEPWVSPTADEEERRKAKKEAVQSEAEILSMAAAAADLDDDESTEGVDVINWEDEEGEELLDNIEENLIREAGRG